MHLDDEQLERMRHGELARDGERSVREHLENCAECRALAAAAVKEEAEVNALLRGLDHAPPRIQAADIAARARSLKSSRMRWAAGLLLAAAAGTAAIAAPGLPVRDWLGDVVERITVRSDAPRKPAAQRDSDSRLAGVAVAPGNALEILFTSRQAAGEIRVSITEDSDVFIRTATGAATFSSDAGRLVIDNKRSSAAFDIGIPRAAPRVEIRVDGIRVFLKQLASITAVARENGEGRYVLPLSP